MRIDTSGTVGSVVMVHTHSNSNDASTKTTYTSIDSAAPFSLCGDTDTAVVDYDTCSLLSIEGNHAITVTPYLSPDATGRRGQPYTTTFRVLNTMAEERKCEVPKVCHK